MSHHSSRLHKRVEADGTHIVGGYIEFESSEDDCEMNMKEFMAIIKERVAVIKYGYTRDEWPEGHCERCGKQDIVSS